MRRASDCLAATPGYMSPEERRARALAELRNLLRHASERAESNAIAIALWASTLERAQDDIDRHAPK